MAYISIFGMTLHTNASQVTIKMLLSVKILILRNDHLLKKETQTVLDQEITEEDR